MNIRLMSLLTLTAALVACASVPERNLALDQARGNFNQAEHDPQVLGLAPAELKMAKESLMQAQQAWISGSPRPTVDHLAYIASQRVVIARETASSSAYQRISSGAAAKREQVRLAARTEEANKAQQQLALSQQSNASKDEQVSDLEAQLKDLNARRTDRGMVVTLGDILFDSGKSQLLPGAQGNMAKLADVFKRNPQRTASIEGYTDNVGSVSSNMDLSSRRANAVMAALVSQGVAAMRLSAKSFGENNPVASNDTPAGRQMNRRVEIVFGPESVRILAQ